MSDEPDTAAVATADHEFAAESVPEWWGRCRICRLSMAAHKSNTLGAATAMSLELEALPYRCPECVWASEFHRPPRHREGCPRGQSSET